MNTEKTTTRKITARKVTNEELRRINERWGDTLDLYFQSKVKSRMDKAKMIGMEMEIFSDGMAALKSGNKVTVCAEGQLTLGKKAFEECCFHSVHIQGVRTSQMKDMSYLFRQSNIEILDLRGMKTSQVKNMQGMFMASRTKEIDLTSFDTSKVISMNGMFDMAVTEELDLRHFDTRNVQTMKNMFSICECKRLDISNFDTSNTRTMENMFQNSVIDQLDISGISVPVGTCCWKIFHHIKVKTEPVIKDAVLRYQWEKRLNQDHSYLMISFRMAEKKQKLALAIETLEAFTYSELFLKAVLEKTGENREEKLHKFRTKILEMVSYALMNPGPLKQELEYRIAGYEDFLQENVWNQMEETVVKEKWLDFCREQEKRKDRKIDAVMEANDADIFSFFHFGYCDMPDICNFYICIDQYAHTWKTARLPRENGRWCQKACIGVKDQVKLQIRNRAENAFMEHGKRKKEPDFDRLAMLISLLADDEHEDIICAIGQSYAGKLGFHPVFDYTCMTTKENDGVRLQFGYMETIQIPGLDVHMFILRHNTEYVIDEVFSIRDDQISDVSEAFAVLQEKPRIAKRYQRFLKFLVGDRTRNTEKQAVLEEQKKQAVVESLSQDVEEIRLTGNQLAIRGRIAGVALENIKLFYRALNENGCLSNV